MEFAYAIVHHPIDPVRSCEIYNDKQVTVDAIPLKHSIPVAGFIFREKKRLLNIRKDVIEQYGMGILDIRGIKEGHDYTTLEGITIANHALTYPPYKPRSYAFCTDTAYTPKLAKQLQDIDLLYFEATFADKDKKMAKVTGHSTASQAALLAKHCGAGKLIIGHFSTRYKDVSMLLNEARAIFPETYAVEDGAKYPVRQQRADSST
jgi:ribonuclease Z